MAQTTLKLQQTIYNPYKFNVYRSAGLTSSVGNLIIPFDTKMFDTGTNIDVVTNKGRFTVPVAGFYFFSAYINTQSNTRQYLGLYKNGSEIARGNDFTAGTTANAQTVCGLFQLAVNDYIEVNLYTTAAFTVTTGSAYCSFQGFLVSAT